MHYFYGKNKIVSTFRLNISSFDGRLTVTACSKLPAPAHDVTAQNFYFRCLKNRAKALPALLLSPAL